MDIQKIRADFPILRNTGVIYFDNAATTLKPQCVIDKMNEYYTQYCANVHRGAHQLSVRASEEYEKAHEIIANFLSAKHEEIVMTQNTTHAINIVALSLPWKKLKGKKIIVSNLEHHSNLLPWMAAAKTHGLTLEIVYSDKEGNFNLEDWKKASKDAAIVSVTAASNVLGVKTPVAEISKIAHDNGALFCTDAAAAAGHIELDVKKIKPDFLALSGHKGPLGPTGTGALYINEKHFGLLEPGILGGGTIDEATFSSYKLSRFPDRFEAGTPNIAGVIGFGEGVRYIQKIGIRNIEKHSAEITKYCIQRLSEIKNLEIISHKNADNNAGIVAFEIKGADPHEVSLMLDNSKKIATRSGYHCAYPLHTHLGKKGSVRASFHLYNTKEEIDVFAEELSKIAQILA
ncbi:Cysteine desulfurase [uncultured archaeon]|nr:Cysteine desulfurase [uncultured archaeon]